MRWEGNYSFDVAFGKLKEQAIKLHYERYLEVGFFKNGDRDDYENHSIYFSVQNLQNSKVVGVTRLIMMKVEDLPTLKHFAIYDIEKTKLSQINQRNIAEISAFTKLPQHEVGLGLIKTVLQYSIENSINYWICCIDERVYNYMHRTFKFPFKVIGEPQVYLGSKTIPCFLNLFDCLSILKEFRPKLYDYFTFDQPTKSEVMTK